MKKALERRISIAFSSLRNQHILHAKPYLQNTRGQEETRQDGSHLHQQHRSQEAPVG